MSESPDAAQPATTPPAEEGLVLRFAAISDVGRVRKDNQDSGYAGPHVLAVCDGVGGAARGDIASSTAIGQLKKVDEDWTSIDWGTEDTQEALLAQVAGAIHRAHDRIGEQVDEDPGLNGTSTTLSALMVEGRHAAVGHVGDSRAYLRRSGVLTQLTKDHTFVQSLIDEGRITEDEARTHPHRNLILKAVDGIHETDPDLFTIELAPGDRILLCSDGACGVLDDDRMNDILGTGTPEFAAVELVRSSLEAGSSDNVTCVVADVHAAGAATDSAGDPDGQTPHLVGAAADLPRRRGLFRGHRSGDTGEFEAVQSGQAGHGTPEIPEGLGHAVVADPIDPEEARYAPQAPSKLAWIVPLAGALLLCGTAWIVGSAAYAWSQNQFYVGEDDGYVTIYRGVDASLLGWELAKPYERSDVQLDQLSAYDADQVREGIDSADADDARDKVQNYASRRETGSTGSSGSTGGSGGAA